VRTLENTSSPMRPAITTFPPALDAATAWLAPLPPGLIRKSVPGTVSPAPGRLDARTTKSHIETAEDHDGLSRVRDKWSLSPLQARG
jgi:hypothetical protein